MNKLSVISRRIRNRPLHESRALIRLGLVLAMAVLGIGMAIALWPVADHQPVVPPVCGRLTAADWVAAQPTQMQPVAGAVRCDRRIEPVEPDATSQPIVATPGTGAPETLPADAAVPHGDPRAEPTFEQTAALARAVQAAGLRLPLALVPANPAALTPAMQHKIRQLQEEFWQEVGTQTNFEDSVQRQRWTAAQCRADERYRCLFGWQAFNEMQLQRALDQMQAAN